MTESVITFHKDYSDTIEYVEMVRDCIEGEPAIKRKGSVYLKHPNHFDKTSTEQDKRYQLYIDGAEFDGNCQTTEQDMLGLMTGGEANIDLPEKISYLEQNADGDGMPLMGVVEMCYKNSLEVKFHVLLAEYSGLADVDIDQVTMADVKRLKPRASIREYNRESLVDWAFQRIDGKMQISMLLLRECGTRYKPGSLVKEDFTSYLMLALDENGDYFQRRYNHENSTFTPGNDHYPSVGGKNLKWIPAEIIADEETPAGRGVPRGLGLLYKICAKDLYSYRVSADYKEALRLMQPTVFGSGWKEGDDELFEKLNGRKYVAFGAGVYNAMPDGVENEVISLATKDEAFLSYFEQNTKKSRALGATTGDDDKPQQTATEAGINNRKSMAAMSMIVRNTEAGIRRIVSYCAMYEGLWDQDAVEENLDQIVISLPMEFAKQSMTEQEVSAVVNVRNSGLSSKAESMRKLEAGGFYVEDIETILDEIDNEAPPPIKLPALGQRPPIAVEDE